ncbi:MAG: glycosyltransferase family 4 protein [Candidatus Baldrarchaeia archaeon]
MVEINKIKNFDVLHQIHFFDLGGAAVYAKKVLGKPLITTLGGWDTYDPLIKISRIFHPYRKWVMVNSDTVTSISKDLATNAKFQGYKG